MRKTIKQWIITPVFKYCIQVDLPAMRAVCHHCGGEGTTVNPSIDDNGITGQEMEEMGDDFRESYMAGDYDVSCPGCNGNRVLDILDWEMLSPKLQAAAQEYINEERASEAEAAAERRWGA